jgi:cell division protein ZipA
MMPELRWTLLIIGVLFIAILAWWERRRPHQASRQAPHIGAEPRPVVNNDPSWNSDGESGSASARLPHIVREPILTLPEIRGVTREPVAPRELPIVEIDDPIEPDEEIPEEKLSEELEEISDEITQDASVEVAKKVSRQVEREAEELEAEQELDAEEGEDAGLSGVRAGDEDPEMTVAEDDGKTGELPTSGVPIGRPIVEWPPEDQRKVISLRLVARPPDRFRGALVRQALYAEGFALGEFDIFHKPDAQNRAVLSVASLTKPGTFDLETMDTLRYSGLNLFAVLPGPKSPRKAFEELLMVARTLNERLEGALQDEKGGPLTPMRIQALRDALEVETKS